MLAPFLFAVDFMNFTYARNPCSTNVPVPVVMRRGNFSYFDDKMGVGFDVHVDSVKEDSLQAGTRQAVVVIACDYPVGGTAGAYLFQEHGRTATLLGEVGSADWGVDWGAGPNSIRVRFANSVLYVEECADSECTAKSRAKYALRRGKLAKL